MKHILIAVAIAAISATAYGYDSTVASATVLQQNEQNDPSIHGRRTQTAFELGGVGQEQPADTTQDSVPVDDYPAKLGQTTVQEDYPAKECDNCHNAP